MTDTINLVLGALMGIACMIVFARIHDQKNLKSDGAFALFWGIWWWTIVVVYALLHFAHAPYWVAQSFDMVGNVSLFVAAYALHKGTGFDYRSPDIVRIVVAAVILTALCVIGGLLGPERSVDWHVFAMAPSQVLATTAFILLGVAAGERFPDFRVSIYILCGIYAILQVPAYHAVFIEPLEMPNSATMADFWKWSLAAGKLAFAINSAAVLGFLKSRHLRRVSTILAFLSAILGFAIAVIRFLTTVTP